MSAMPTETFAPIEVIEGTVESGFLFLADHASNALPPEYGTLGLPATELQRHIGWDPGTAAIVRALAARFQAPALLTCFSRLLIDPNRGETDPTLIMRLSDGAVVPGNARIDAAERARRITRFYRPYHDAVAAAIDRAIERGQPPIILSMHSYTPVWRGYPRPWHCGILWDNDPRLPQILIAALGRDPALVVGDNEPYDGALRDDTMFRHATSRGLAHAIIEVRQDLIGHADGAAEWADRIAGIIAPLAADPALRAIRHHGSRTDPR
ncbi:MAG: N-formylglutamate amidohydrolase [Hyphomicrobiaceae bacterium]|nr:N-formylglutamate amidohydrolase [Hyphomicrobiaceae bacterium]